MGPQGPPGAKILPVSELLLDDMRCQNQWFYTILSLHWPVLALLKPPNALKMGHFGTKNESTMGQKHYLQKRIFDCLGCTNK